jgi:hypothetical protein
LRQALLEFADEKPEDISGIHDALLSDYPAECYPAYKESTQGTRLSAFLRQTEKLQAG